MSLFQTFNSIIFMQVKDVQKEKRHFKFIRVYVIQHTTEIWTGNVVAIIRRINCKL